LHEGSQHTSFADGHVERRWWRSARSTILPVRYNYMVPPAFDEAGRQDFAWLMEWAAVRMDGSNP
jgi:prepilin-type processing-associated H-X9-DG protein